MPPKKKTNADREQQKMLRRAAARLLREADKSAEDANLYQERAADAVDANDENGAIAMQRLALMKKAMSEKQRALSVNLTVIEEVLHDASAMSEMATLLSSVNVLLSRSLENTNDKALEEIVKMFHQRCTEVDALGAKGAAAFAKVANERGPPEKEILEQLAPLWEAKALETGASIPDVVRSHIEERDNAEVERLNAALPAAVAALPEL